MFLTPARKRHARGVGLVNNGADGPDHFENVVELDELLPANRYPQAGSEVINTGRQVAALDPPPPD